MSKNVCKLFFILKLAEMEIALCTSNFEVSKMYLTISCDQQQMYI